jgi:hypothetical protein
MKNDVETAFFPACSNVNEKFECAINKDKHLFT